MPCRVGATDYDSRPTFLGFVAVPGSDTGHPSCTGLLLIAAGIGLAAGIWPGLVVCLLLPVVAMLRRIRVEEATLARVIGDPYRTYQSRTKRLVPGLW